MIVLMTSSTPNRTRSTAATEAHAAPAAAATNRANMMSSADGSASSGAESTSAVAAAAPQRNCPSAPMLKTPALNATDTAHPVSINGTVRTRVDEVNAYQLPSE